MARRRRKLKVNNTGRKNIMPELSPEEEKFWQPSQEVPGQEMQTEYAEEEDYYTETAEPAAEPEDAAEEIAGDTADVPSEETEYDEYAVSAEEIIGEYTDSEPAEEVFEYADDEPAEEVFEYADDEPAEEVFEYADDEPAEEVFEYADDEPAEEVFEYADDDEPAEEVFEYADDEPAEEAFDYADEAEPAEESGDYSDDEEPEDEAGEREEYTDLASFLEGLKDFLPEDEPADEDIPEEAEAAPEAETGDDFAGEPDDRFLTYAGEEAEEPVTEALSEEPEAEEPEEPAAEEEEYSFEEEPEEYTSTDSLLASLKELLADHEPEAEETGEEEESGEPAGDEEPAEEPEFEVTIRPDDYYAPPEIDTSAFDPVEEEQPQTAGFVSFVEEAEKEEEPEPFDFNRDFEDLKRQLAGALPEEEEEEKEPEPAAQEDDDFILPDIVVPGTTASAAAAAGTAGAAAAGAAAVDAAAEDWEPDDDFVKTLLRAAEAQPADEPDIDERFNVSGETKKSMIFGGSEADTSVDPDYIPPKQEEYFATGFDDDEAGETPAEEKKSRLGRLFGRRDGDLPSLFGKKRAAAPAEEAAELPADGPEEAAAGETAESAEADLPADEYTVDEAQAILSEYAARIGAETQSAGPAEETEGSAPAVSEDTHSYNAADIRAAYAQAFPDAEPDPAAAGKLEDRPGDAYIDDDDYDYTDADGDDYEYKGEEHDYFPSFRDYVASLIATVLYRFRRGEQGGSATMEDKQENLGREVNTAQASKYYGSFTRSLKLRLRISAVILVLMLYLSSGWAVPGMLKSTVGCAEALLAMQLTLMVLSLDIVTEGIMNAVRRQAGASSLAVLSCILTSADVLISAVGGAGTAHIPLCALSSLSLVGLLFAAYLHAKGMRKALRVPAISRRAYTVTGEMNVKPKEITLLKSVRPTTGFVRRCEEEAPDEEFFRKAAPALVIAAVLLGLIACAVHRSLSSLIWYVSAILAVGVPFTSLLAFSLPFFLGSVSIFKSGAAIAGWSGLTDIGRSTNLIVTDRDVFPEGTVDFDSVRVFADESEAKVVSYAGSMLMASGSCLAAPFGGLMERVGCSMQKIEGFEFLSGGGMKGLINGDRVICGNSDMLRLENVKVPFRLVGKNTVLLAINGVLYGIFNMKYTADPDVREALVRLMQSGRHPIFAIRDFNVTPELLHDCFDVATDGYDFPPYMERFRMSAASPSEDSKIAAVVCREGLGPLTHMADTGLSMYRAIRINVAVTGAGAVLGMLIMFIRLLAAGTVNPGFFILMMIILALPVFFVSVFMKE